MFWLGNLQKKESQSLSMGTAWGKDAEEAKASSNTGGSEATNTDPIIDVVVIRANGDEIKLESSETIDVRALKEQFNCLQYLAFLGTLRISTQKRLNARIHWTTLRKLKLFQGNRAHCKFDSVEIQTLMS
jgi:hypothetical protein